MKLFKATTSGLSKLVYIKKLSNDPLELLFTPNGYFYKHNLELYIHVKWLGSLCIIKNLHLRRQLFKNCFDH